MRPARLIAEMAFVGRLDIDDGRRGRVLPVPARRPGMDPAQRLRVVPVAALVDDEVEPRLVAEGLPGPDHPAGMRRHRSVRLRAAKDGTPDASPAFTGGSRAVAIAGQGPHHVPGAIAGHEIEDERGD